MSTPNRDVHRLGDKIGGSAFEIEGDIDLWIAQQKLGELLGQDVDPKPHPGADLEDTSRLARQTANVGDRVAEAGDDLGAAVEQRMSGRGQHNVSRGALEQAHAKRALEPGDRAADVRFGQAKRSRRRREAFH